MGKNVPLRIGRKNKRELNPVEKMRKKEKHKKNIKQFIKKINQKANGEFKSKVKVKRSPSPESNDPMLQELISSSSLRTPVPKTNELDPITEVYEPEKKIPEIIPTVLNRHIDPDPSSELSEESEDYRAVAGGPSVKQDQSIYKTFLESDSKLTDFFDSVRDFL